MNLRLTSRRRRVALIAALAASALLLSACSGDSEGAGAGSEPDETTEPAAITNLRLGFFPNVTHAPALIGLQEGLFKAELDPLGIRVQPTSFNAGPDAVAAMFGGSLDITYIGPNPAINAFQQSEGEAVRIIAGAASAGASLVVRDGINSPEDLVGKTIATPQLGNTQDVAARSWLKELGYETDVEGGGDVSIIPVSNSEGLSSFVNGDIDGAWVPEPWATLYQEEGAKVLLNERELWPAGQFVTTHVMVSTTFLEQYPEIVEAFLRGHVAALQFAEDDPKAAQATVNASLKSLTGSDLDPKVLDQAFTEVDFIPDPLPETLKESAADAVDVGLLDGDALEAAGPLDDLYDVALLNKVLADAGLPEVAS